MSASKAKAAPVRGLPLFGVEIELYVKVRPKLEVLTREKQRTNPKSLPEWWQKWDFDLKNDPANRDGQRTVMFHRLDCVTKAVLADINAMLGPNNGWRCEADPSMSERKLALPPDARKWWGVEIISPPMSVSKQWQQEIDMVYKAVSKTFELYTTDFCGCHVHVSPGPVNTKENRYKLPELVRMAKAAFFWEAALCEYLPPDRRESEYAVPNHKRFAKEEYEKVPQKGWGPVFNKLDGLAVGEEGLNNFIVEIQGGEIKGDRYISCNFDAFKDIGTVEFRRQAGVLSPITTGHRILLALGLHLSALRYDFDGAKTRKTYPSAEELRKELAGCIKKLPDTCHGSRFLNYLTWCHESYQGKKRYTETQINAREQALRRGIELPVQQSAVLPKPPAVVPGEGRPLPPSPTYSSTDVESSEDEETPAPVQGSSRGGRGGARASTSQGGQGRGGARGRTPASGAAPRPTTTAGTARGGNAGAQGTGSRAPAASTTPRASTATGTGRGGAAQSTGRGGAAQGTGRGAAAQGTGRGGAAQGTGRGGAAQSTGTPARTSGGAPTPQASGGGGRGAPASPRGGAGGAGPRSPTARTSGGGRGSATGTQGAGGAGSGPAPARTNTNTTRLPERPAASASASASRPAASSNATASSSASRTATTGNSTGGTAAGTTRPPARRRQEGEGA